MIEAQGLRKGYGERLLIDNLSFSLPRGGIVGIIGPNGAGKTTLFRMITGAEKPDAGQIRVGPSVKLAYVDQSRQTLNDKKTVWQEISGGLDMIKVGNYETPSRGYVGRFNFKGTQQQQLIGELSGGERNRVHLAKVLRSGGNVLLLDEPTNDLDVETLRALEEALRASPAAPSSSPTIAGSSTASRPISSPSRATRRWSGSKATTRTTPRTTSAARARKPRSRTDPLQAAHALGTAAAAHPCPPRAQLRRRARSRSDPCGAGSARSRRCWCSPSSWPSCTTNSRSCISSACLRTCTRSRAGRSSRPWASRR